MIQKEGLENLSLRKVARKIEYSPAGMYEYFANKEALIEAVHQQGLNLMNERLTAVPQDLPWKERLVCIGEAYLQFAADEPEIYHLLFSKLSSRRTSLQNKVRENSPYSHHLKAIIAGIDSGEIQLTVLSQPKRSLLRSGLCFMGWQC